MTNISSCGSEAPEGALPESAPILAPPIFDPEEYRAELAGLELTGEQETELLQTLWSIMHSCVELGWSVDLACEQLFEGFNEVSGAKPDGVALLSSTAAETPSTDGREEPSA